MTGRCLYIDSFFHSFLPWPLPGDCISFPVLYSAGPGCLFIFYIIVCICEPQTPCPSLPDPSLLATASLFSVCVASILEQFYVPSKRERRAHRFSVSPRRHPHSPQAQPPCYPHPQLEFPGGLVVKDPASSLLRLGSWLWSRFCPWPGNVCVLQGVARKINE